MAFRRALRDPFGALSGWDPSSPLAPCNWRGVACSPSGSGSGSAAVVVVVELRLPRLRLSGPISPRLGDLPNLKKLSLRSNSLSGPIPGSLFSRLPRLRSLFLQSNSLSGPLPDSLLMFFSIRGDVR
ncbi:putative LRR receptor-like serine/threonine-protein kinase [Ananas comosus]|uniref:Putative LRR receptor-like serine/threonine-protein kinase n=1 Tax=Ananas comosus TaxID=4615 RepID=A0A199VIE2_ANACO|nr:putative LRR receptor-like serine/threonine-protein kinase [Ananas comosus]